MKYTVFLLTACIIFFITDVYGQKQSRRLTVSGVVVDANNNPVSGASILVNNRSVDQTTDRNGFYRVRIRPTDTLITVFMMNVGLKEEPIRGRDVINFKLGGVINPNAQNIQARENDQEYNIGYGTVKKSEMTTSVGKIDATNKKYASYTNIYDLIKGEVPGVQVAGKKIIIQGPTSLNLNTDPLIIVNGIETHNLDDISPRQVKSIEVLKGSAASIYGSRGANGVIIITLLDSRNK